VGKKLEDKKIPYRTCVQASLNFVTHEISFCFQVFENLSHFQNVQLKFHSIFLHEEGFYCVGRYSDLLRAGRSGDRIPVGAIFSAPVQTGSGAHPASYTMGTGSFPGLKPPGRDVDNPPPSSAQVKERVGLYLYFPSGLSWPVLG